jgi:hypothetical protein
MLYFLISVEEFRCGLLNTLRVILCYLLIPEMCTARTDGALLWLIHQKDSIKWSKQSNNLKASHSLFIHAHHEAFSIYIWIITDWLFYFMVLIIMKVDHLTSTLVYNMFLIGMLVNEHQYFLNQFRLKCKQYKSRSFKYCRRSWLYINKSIISMATLNTGRSSNSK